jgi:hypothetical protein
MRRALEGSVVAALRDGGFTGTWPHFRRPSKGRIDLVSFQFDKWGGGFCVEVGVAPPKDIRSALGYRVAATKVTAHHLAHRDGRVIRRWRLGARRRGSDHWYRYDAGTSEGRFAKIADKVLADIRRQAEPFWSDASL